VTVLVQPGTVTAAAAAQGCVQASVGHPMAADQGSR
jgi:hypothetical protein